MINDGDGSSDNHDGIDNVDGGGNENGDDNDDNDHDNDYYEDKGYDKVILPMITKTTTLCSINQNERRSVWKDQMKNSANPQTYQCLPHQAGQPQPDYFELWRLKAESSDSW